jgi:four helix bundle protein
MSAQSYKDLEIYKKAHKPAIEVHRMSLGLPQFEMYEEGRQIRKSSKSTKTNIVEGFGRRRYKAEFIRFLTYSLGSCDETVDHLNTLYETRPLSDEDTCVYFREEYDHLGRMINNFIKSVEAGHNEGPDRRTSSIENQASKIVSRINED